MKPSDQLFRLIKALDKSEKGYFKKFAQGYGKDQNYLLLFDAIDAQESYDEAALLKKFRSQPFAKQISVAKNYLWELILKSQRQYRTETSKFMQLNTLMESGEILFEKGLYEEAVKVWDKAKQLAALYDEKPFMLDIETNKRRFYIDMTAGKWMEFTDPSYSESFKLIESYTQMLKIQQKYVQIVNYIKTQPFFRTDEQKQPWDEFMKDPLLAAGNEPESFYGKLYFNYIYNIYHLLCRNKEESIAYIRKIVELWDAHPVLKNAEPVKYLSAVNNYLTNLMFLKENKQFIEYFEQFKSPHLNSISKEAVYFEHLWLMKYTYYHLKNDFDGSMAFIEASKKDLERYIPYINKARLMIIRFVTAMYHTVLGEFEKSNDLLNLILSSKEIELRKDIQAMARILNTINHYEVGNTILLKHVITTSKHYLKTNDSYYETERIFMRHMTNLVKIAGNREKKEAFSKMHEDFSELFASNETEQTAFESIRILDWIRSKIEGRPHLEIMRGIVQD